MGASPERLLKISEHRLTTDALAGSAPRGRTPEEDARLAKALLHSSKDQYEHQVVTDFVNQCLLQLELQPHFSSAPHLLQLPNIQHLRTIIHAHLPRQLHLLEILAALHPTPAVAGAPREITCEHIQRYEAFERDLFGAPLGWVDYQGNGEFIVGIRSALIDDKTARLYAGAGIVAASDPDKEVAEIGLKLQALLNALS
jgi:menaquinone-specific isochorismate synthase